MNTSTRSHDGLALIHEQQKAKALYGATEGRFCRCYAEAARRPDLVGDNFLLLLEKHLPNVASQLGFAHTRPRARQIISHSHVLINNRRRSRLPCHVPR
jgi:small subunit ribosomal protein S4